MLTPSANMVVGFAGTKSGLLHLGAEVVDSQLKNDN